MKKLIVWGLIASGVLIVVVVIVAIVSVSNMTPEEREALHRETVTRDSIRALKEAERALASEETMSYVIAQDFVKTRLKFPKTADFPLLPVKTSYEGNGLYSVVGTVTASNAFGVESEYRWSASLRYKGSNASSLTSWELVELDMR